MYPVHGGQPRPLKGLSTSDAVVNWSADGRYLYTYTRGEAPARMYRVEIMSGKREFFKATSPPDYAGVHRNEIPRISNEKSASVYRWSEVAVARSA